MTTTAPDLVALYGLTEDHDLFGLPFDEAHGATGTSALMLCVATEKVATACASSSLLLDVPAVGSLPIRLAGSEELKQRVLPRLASGEWLAAVALSEPDAGSVPARCARAPSVTARPLAVGPRRTALGIAQGATDYAVGYARKRIAVRAAAHRSARHPVQARRPTTPSGA
jgi:alkylation response protein AidB-like acyl-CoA dehydrogenase